MHQLALRWLFAPRKWKAVVLLVLSVVPFGYSLRLLNVRASAQPTGPLPQLSSIFTPEVRHWSPLIFAWASAYNVDPNLIATVIQIESCGDPLAVSGSGAQGLFQVMPFHFQPDENMLEVLTNGKRGMEYLAGGLLKAGGDAGLALAGYNGGHGMITRSATRWPEETKRYYQWGSGIYQDAVQGKASSVTMQKWLDAGGRRLCAQASSRQLMMK